MGFSLGPKQGECGAAFRLLMTAVKVSPCQFDVDINGVNNSVRQKRGQMWTAICVLFTASGRAATGGSITKMVRLGGL